MSTKKILIIIISIVLFITVVALYFVFDINSQIDLLKHPEKYSFKANFASQIIQNDYYIGKNLPEWDSFYTNLKENEKKYNNKNAETRKKAKYYNNMAFDLYHDILSMNLKNYKKYEIKGEYFLEQDKDIADILNMLIHLKTNLINIENFSTLEYELNTRKEAIRVVNEDLKNRKINAHVSIQDVKYENLTPVYIDEDAKPQYIKDFDKILQKIIKSSNEYFNSKVQKCTLEQTIQERSNCYITQKNYASNKFWEDIQNLDEDWKHRYIILAVEKKQNNEKIFHMYEAHPYKEGNRYYWDIQYYSYKSEFLKAYLKMLELLMSI